jgi:hypothetical protein
MSPANQHSLVLMLLLALLSAAIYLPGSWWGAPHATMTERTKSWGVDDETPLGPLAEVHNIIQPKPDRNYGYPLMYSFIVSAAYTPYLAWLYASGQWTEISGVYPFGMKDPVTTLRVMTWIAHFVTVLMAVGMLLATFETGRILKDRRTGVLAALFAMTSYPMFYYARSGNVDIPMLFFVALTIMMFARCMTDGFTAKRAGWLGAFAGFALATKEPAIGIFLAIPFILLPLAWREHDGRWTSWPFWRAPATGLLAAFLALGTGSGLFVEPSRYFRHIDDILSHIDMITAGAVYVPYVFPFSLEGNIAYLQRVLELLAAMMSWPGLLLAIGGLVMLLVKKHPARGLAVLVIVFLVFVFFTLRSPQLRYFIPAGWLLAFPAAWLVATATESGRPLLRKSAWLLAAGVIAFNLLRGAGLTWEMIHDSRYAAGTWLAEHTETGDTIEYFGPHGKLPPFPAGVRTRIATFYGGIYVPVETDAAKVEEILQGWRERRPKYVILMPDLTSRPGTPYNMSCPPELCDGMLDGSLGFTLEARFRTEPLFTWLKLPPLDYPTVNPPIHIFSLPEEPAA